MTRRLNELHINEVIKCINEDTLTNVSITKVKKPRGAYNINYNYNREVNNTVTISKGVTGYNVKVQLVKALNEIKEAIKEHKLQSVILKYDRAVGKLEYQLIQK